MSTSRALFLKEKYGAFELGTKPRPSPGPGEILVKEVAVALNPSDWKTQAYAIIATDYPVVLGRDAAGQVEAVGEGVTHIKKGDRVFHPGAPTSDNHHGTFQEYTLVSAEIAAKIPEHLTYEQAASLPLGVGTVFLPFYSPSPVGVGLKLPWDGGRGQYAEQPILIFGGSTSVAQYVIQFARLSGFSPIITTASLKNTDFLRSLGATHVIDRNIPDAAFPSEIAKITTKPIPLVYVAVTPTNVQQLGYDTLAEGGHIVIVIPVSVKEAPRSTKKVLTAFGSVVNPAHREVGRILMQNLPALLEAGDLVPNPIEIVPGGLNGIVPGLERLKNDLVSARKLVVHPEETA